MVRAMLMQSGLQNSLWSEAANTAVYLHNWIPSKVTGITPFEAWFGNKPGLKHLKIFGSKAYAHIPKEKRGKLDARSEIGFVVVYPLDGKGDRVYNPQTHTVQARNVVYVDERNLPCVFNVSDQSSFEIDADNVIAWLPEPVTSNLAGQTSEQASKEANETEGETGTTVEESNDVQPNVRCS
ncbi:hypothetical protein JRQ81_001418 [Phrynocephalus forsythii]|uniref:Retroviral polymerase SH3-like domain-containing protein n=1 Tax=Phrynocephalus forsythii TaxID=171643 RepID=A0A9Q1B7V0_9SAUR|nr:hypothetical protein JRQ81_001418 [Phrynocephalus forsythii]